VAVGEPSYSSVVEHIEEDKDAKEQIVSGLSNQELAKVKPVIDKQLVASILLGDAFHNLADGILIAASFVSCNISLAISIAAITIVHELAQEIGDFILLTKLAGLSICKALILNFISGMTVVLGGVIFLLAQPTDQATGIMLTIGAGVYVNIAATETMPRLKEIVRTRMDRIWSLIGCIIGTIPIGLVLLNHHHCEE
jgi:zinc transporter ZupT